MVKREFTQDQWQELAERILGVDTAIAAAIAQKVVTDVLPAQPSRVPTLGKVYEPATQFLKSPEASVDAALQELYEINPAGFRCLTGTVSSAYFLTPQFAARFGLPRISDEFDCEHRESPAELMALLQPVLNAKTGPERSTKGHP